jgi:hypothetical protein
VIKILPPPSTFNFMLLILVALVTPVNVKIIALRTEQVDAVVIVEGGDKVAIRPHIVKGPGILAT